MENAAAAAAAGTTPHILMFPFLAFGHISPFAQLARKVLAASANTVHISFLTASGNVPRVTALLPPSVSVIPLQLPHVPGLPPGAESTAELTPDGAELIKIALDLTKPQVEEILSRIQPDLVFFDFCQPWLPSLAAPLGIKTIHFSVFAASTMSLIFAISRNFNFHDTTPTVEDLKKPLTDFPPSFPFHSMPTYLAAELTYVFKSFHGQPSVFDRVLTCINGCDAVAAKTCMEMEGPYVKHLEILCGKKLLLAGPVVPELPQGELDPKWEKWLAGFPEGSVVFSSFGSETFLSEEATKELLLGLEMSGFPFLVVLNFPKGGDETQEEMLNKRVPDGFEQRVKGRGVVHCGWVQQQHILRHRSVGCFVNHAGFSSIAEGLIADCQLVMLPQKGDQFINSVLFAGELGVGVEVDRRDHDAWFGREAVRDAIKSAMAGELGMGKGKLGGMHKKWREFLMDGELQEKFMLDFAEGLKDLIGM